MTSEIFDKLREQKQYSRIMEKGKELYRSKPFIEEYYRHWQASTAFRFVLGGVSILTGVSSSFMTGLPLYYCIPISVLLFGAVEVFKNLLLENALQTWFAKRKIKWSVLGSLLLFIASVSVSTLGTVELSKLLDSGQTAKATASMGEEFSDLSAQHDKSIKEAEETAKQFRQDNLVVVQPGKPRALRFNATKQYNKLVDRVQQLKAEKAEALAGLKSSQESHLQVLQGSQEGRKYFLIGICALIELFIVGCIGFNALYLYKSKEEPELLAGASKISVSTDDLLSIAQVAKIQSGANIQTHLQPTLKQTAPEPKKIGFQQTPQTSKQIETEQQQPQFVQAPEKARDVKHSDYYQKYPELVEDLLAINRGEAKATIRELAELHDVHEATIYRIKKAIFI